MKKLILFLTIVAVSAQFVVYRVNQNTKLIWNPVDSAASYNVTMIEGTNVWRKNVLLPEVYLTQINTNLKSGTYVMEVTTVDIFSQESDPAKITLNLSVKLGNVTNIRIIDAEQFNLD